MNNIYSTSLLIFLFIFSVQAQDIKLMNGSFEGPPEAGKVMGRVAHGWKDCGHTSESVPDVHTAATRFFEVNYVPADGEAFLGMVVRDNDTWEGLSQRLLKPLIQGRSYGFDVYLAKNPHYISDSRYHPGEKTDHNKSVKFQIWAGNMYCQREQLLAESELVDHQDWKLYQFSFVPITNYDFFMIRAFYETPTLVPYNGNILVDNCSSIYVMDEEEAKKRIAQNPVNPANQTAFQGKDQTFEHRKKARIKTENKNTFEEIANLNVTDQMSIDLSEENSEISIDWKAIKDAEVYNQINIFHSFYDACKQKQLTQIIYQYDDKKMAEYLAIAEALPYPQLFEVMNKMNTIYQKKDAVYSDNEKEFIKTANQEFAQLWTKDKVYTAINEYISSE